MSYKLSFYPIFVLVLCLYMYVSACVCVFGVCGVHEWVCERVFVSHKLNVK